MHKKYPLISIAMTTFNGQKFLIEQIDSLINQTYPNLEIIICDDNSTDQTLQILNQYKNDNIKIFKNDKNLGFVKNFEKAILLCNGEYIALCDQDDIWMCDKIETLFNNIEDNLLICSGYSIIDENANKVKNILLKDIEKYDYKKYKDILLMRNFVTGCTVLFKKDLLKKALPIPENVYHDRWLGFFAARENKLKVFTKPLIFYRRHGLNVSQKQSFFNKLNVFLDNKNFLKNIILKEDNFIAKQCFELINSIEKFNFTKKDFQLIKFQFYNRKIFHASFLAFYASIVLRLILRFRKSK